MEESGWFVPIEREGLANLLNERKIIRSSRANYDPNTDPNQLLPPLLFAGILLEGGIIGYDTNILTGGAGVRYFGTGASGQYREDRVTIYLRAISTSNGRVLKTVYTSKTVLSQQVDVGIFRFVSLQRLLEAETGFTYNEPGEMAVKEAIEKAVQGLIIEGLFENLWQAQQPDSVNTNAVVQAYVKEKSEKDLIDEFGARYTQNRGKLGIGLYGTGLLYDGDFPNSAALGGGEFSLEYCSAYPLSAKLNIGFGRIGASNGGYQGNVGYAELSGNFRFFQNLNYTPFFRLGFGAFTEFSNNQQEGVQPFDNIYPHFVGEMVVPPPADYLRIL
jgi:curli production assembly/transport component CsgG